MQLYKEGRGFETGLEKWGPKGCGGHQVQRLGELRAVGGSVADVVWMRGLKGRRGRGSPSSRAGAINWDPGLGTEDTHLTCRIPLPPNGLL